MKSTHSESQIIWVNPKELTASPRRGESMSAQAVESIKTSIRDIGFSPAFPISVTKQYIVAQGHTRLRAAIELGLNSVPIVVLSDEEARRVEVEGDKYTYGMYAGKAMEWIAYDYSDYCERHAGEPDVCDSKVYAAIANEYGLSDNTVKWLHRAFNADDVSRLIVNLKHPNDAALLYQQIFDTNNKLVAAKRAKIPVDLQNEWFRMALKGDTARHSIQSKLGVYRLQNLPEVTKPGRVVVRKPAKSEDNFTEALAAAVDNLLEYGPLSVYGWTKVQEWLEAAKQIQCKIADETPSQPEGLDEIEVKDI